MIQETKPTGLIAVYGRVSTSNQENEGTIDTQLSAVREFAKNNNHAIIKEYTDEGWSGDSIVRPALDQLRIDAKKKIWDAVLMYDPDRLARRYSYQELIMDELREAGIKVLFVTISSPQNSEDKILYGVRGLFAEYERSKISERFRLGKLRKVKEGHILVSEALYGFTYIRGDREKRVHGRYEINPTEAKIVKMIYTWIANERMNIRQVVLRLQELGIKPRRSKRGVWNTSTITTMLNNKAYIGKARWGSSYAVVPTKPIKTERYKKMKKSSRRRKPESEWIASEIEVPKIIDEQLFNKAREQLKLNSLLCTRNKKNQYLLGGKIKCICGRTRGGEGPQHGKHLYYRCNDRNYSFPFPPTCKEQGINARIADQLVWDKLAQLMSSPELMARQINRWTKTQEDGTRPSVGDPKLLEKEILKLKIQEERYNKAYGAGAFDIEQLKGYTSSIRDQIRTFELQKAKIKEAEIKTTSQLPNQNEIMQFAAEAIKMLGNLNYEAKRAIILSTLDKVIGTQQGLEVYGQVPVGAGYLSVIQPSHVNFKTSHRNRRTAKCGEEY